MADIRAQTLLVFVVVVLLRLVVAAVTPIVQDETYYLGLGDRTRLGLFRSSPRGRLDRRHRAVVSVPAARAQKLNVSSSRPARYPRRSVIPARTRRPAANGKASAATASEPSRPASGEPHDSPVAAIQATPGG